MKRDLSRLNANKYDVLVVGAGIYGACAAWDAAQRGLSVALLEAGDFSHATSANSYKIVHGGIRYLQQADFALVRASSQERNALLRIAPHLIHPLPIVIPTYGYGLKGKAILRAGFLVYDLMTCDRNNGIADRDRWIPNGRALSRDHVLDLFPGLPTEKLTGGVIMCDAQMYNPPRLALSFIRSAVRAGADAANYVRVINFLRDGRRVTGVEATDVLTGTNLCVRARVVLNTAGPWADNLLKEGVGLDLAGSRPSFSRDVGLVVKRKSSHEHGLATSARTKDATALIDRGERHLFLLPWRDYTLVGVWHKRHTGNPDEFSVSAEEISDFIDEVNSSYPTMRLTPDDVTAINTGLILFGDENQSTDEHKFAKRSSLIDHAGDHNLDGLITLIGVRATTARRMAAEATDLILTKLGKPAVKTRTDHTPIFGGDIPSVENLVRRAQEEAPLALPPEAVRSLIRNYGAEYPRVLQYASANPELAQLVAGSQVVVRAEIVHAVREEMAVHLEDVILRRTDLGTAAAPKGESIDDCARLMANELHWDAARTREEVENAIHFFSHLGAKKNFRIAARP